MSLRGEIRGTIDDLSDALEVACLRLGRVARQAHVGPLPVGPLAAAERARTVLVPR
jgi:hypothetical protein